MQKKTLVTVLLVVALVLIFGISFAIGGLRTDPDQRFVGTDSAATAQIQASNPGYRPWFQPFFQPASSEIESGLFALQAGIGGTVLGFAIGGMWGLRRGRAASAAVPQAAAPQAAAAAPPHAAAQATETT